MFRFCLLMLFSAGLYAAQSGRRHRAAAKIYQDAAFAKGARLVGAMAGAIRKLFSADTARSCPMSSSTP